jgi:hypothetical protein
MPFVPCFSAFFFLHFTGKLYSFSSSLSTINKCDYISRYVVLFFVVFLFKGKRNAIKYNIVYFLVAFCVVFAISQLLKCNYIWKKNNKFKSKFGIFILCVSLNSMCSVVFFHSIYFFVISSRNEDRTWSDLWFLKSLRWPVRDLSVYCSVLKRLYEYWSGRT